MQFIFGFKKICTRDYPSTVHCSKLKPPQLSKDFLLSVGGVPTKATKSNERNTAKKEKKKKAHLSCWRVWCCCLCLNPLSPAASPVIKAPPNLKHGRSLGKLALSRRLGNGFISNCNNKAVSGKSQPPL